jgi:ParB-like chromosome segregation protein Spo0J
MILDVPLRLIDPNPDNARKTFTRLTDLAATIEGLGLLQNLVVVKKAGDEGDGRFELRAGERRFRAMLMLISQERPGWSLDRQIPCKVLEPGREGELEALVENIQREALAPWEDGAAFDRIVQLKGLTFQEIAQQIGKSRSHVSLLVRISRGLSPKLIPILTRIGKSGSVGIRHLDKMAAMIDKDTLGPDHDKQRKWLESYLSSAPKERRRKYRTRRALEDRVRKLSNLDMPENVRAIVDSIVRYLDGDNFVLPEFAKDGTFERSPRPPIEPFMPTELEESLNR